MSSIQNSIRAITPTLCGLLGISLPALSAELPLEAVVCAGREALGGAENGRVYRRCLVFAPDALGSHLHRYRPAMFDAVRRCAPLAVPLRSVIPSVTPVCFASMFTGASPEQHGIRRYEKPVLQCDTLFDALVRAGKRVAIVAPPGCSIGHIFLGRALDYYPEPYDPEVLARTLALLAEDKHDLIVAYHERYDDLLHKTGPYDEQAIAAAEGHVADFVRLAEAFDAAWGRHDRAIVFAPDHGAHTDPVTGRGVHGEDIPDDMEVVHYFGLRRGETLQG